MSGIRMIRKGRVNMLSGSIAWNMLLFSLPLMFSNMLQVLFNMTDVAVVGKFAGPIALGSVGSTSTLITIITGAMLSIGAGVNTVVAYFVGSKDITNAKRAVHTSLIIAEVIGVGLVLIGLVFATPVLGLLNTKPELIEGAAVYLKIYLCGSPALALFNYGNGVLSAVGETRKPLKYLTIAGCINVVLNLFLVIVCKLGVVGVAIASVTAQYVSAMLIIRLLLTTDEFYRLVPASISFSGDIAIRVLRIAVPSMIQYSVFAVANLFVQASINSFDHVAVEGNSAAANFDSLMYNMMVAFYTAATTFIAQNYGARNKKRIMSAYLWAMLYAGLISVILVVIIMCNKVLVLSLFTSDSEVIRYGIIRLECIEAFYYVSAVMDGTTAAARGLGKTVFPTICVIMSSVVFRLIWIFTIFNYYNTLESLYYLYVASWILAAIPLVAYFLIQYRKLKV